MRRKIAIAGLMACFWHSAFGQTELITDGGFESGGTGWVISGVGAAVFNNVSIAADGANYLGMGRVNGASQVAFQMITIPTNTVAATLSFFYNIFSTDTLNPRADTFLVSVENTNGADAVFVLSASAVNTDAGQGPSFYHQKTFDLTSYAGKTIYVYLQAATAASGGNLTFFNIDDVSVLVETTADIPLNDYFTNSIALTGTNTSAIGKNVFATKEPGEPNHAGNPGGKSLWWNWTAPDIGTVTINTDGSSFSTLLAVYTGSSISNLTSIAHDASLSDPQGQNQVKFNVGPGTQYQIAVDGAGGASGNVVLNLSFQPDTTLPKVSISSPSSGAKLTNSTLTVQGTASDNVAVALVEFRLENASGTNDYQPADGTNKWTAVVTDLVPGPNTIRVRATDTRGNVSTTVARTFTYVVVSLLTVAIDGNGTVSPDLNGKLLAVGASFKVTAKPASGSIFAGWGGIGAGDNPSLTFIMQSNGVLTASFILNPFGPVVGNYDGLFFDSGGVAFQSSGFFHAAVTGKGTFSAKVQTAGKSYSMSGHFSATGSSSNSIARKGLNPLTVLLQLDLTGETLTGQISDGVWTADLLANRATFNAKTHPAAQMGKYTLVLRPGDDSATQPGGYSSGTLSVDGSGNVRFSGIMGDTTKAAQTVPISSGGLWPFYVPLNSGNGAALGWLNFTNDPASAIDGIVTWIRLPQAKAKFYPAGFTNTLPVTASAYSFTNGLPVLSFGTGQIALAGGNIQSFTNQITLGVNNKGTGPNKLSLSISTSSGSFKGSVQNPAATKMISVSGVVLQNQNAGFGVFPGTNQTGQVDFGL